MRNTMPQKVATGFTLVELAIVMTIIGLLIGGILKGQELLENARVTSTLAQIKSYDASVTAFRDIYDGIPGDLRGADKRIPNCVASCAPLAANANDGAVGSPTGNYADQSATIATAAQTAVTAETTLFWIHMLKASLISGVTDTALTSGTAAAWGVTHPAAKIGGGFIVGFSNGSAVAGTNATGLSGNSIAIAMLPTTGAVVTATGQNPLTPGRAAQIDRKMDDGVPTTGAVRSYGTATNCADASTPPAYVESVTTKDCGLIIKIQS